MPSESRLASAAWLAERLGSPGVRVIEVASVNDGAAYRAGHLPGTVWWSWKAALWHDTDREFPTAEVMAGRLGRIGVTPDTTVVLYGYTNVRVYDGSWTEWGSIVGFPVET